MDNNRQKSNGNVQHEPENVSSHKQKSLKSSREQLQVMKITDLNDDCLGMIFYQLNLQSLLNVAASNEWLRVAARSVYSRKFGRKTVYIGLNSSLSSFVNNEPLETANTIILKRLKTTLQFLRCFGVSIIRLEISNNGIKSKHSGYVDQYISEYCAGSLIEILFLMKQNIFMENDVQRPFTNVQSVRVLKNELSGCLPSFAERFPNLRQLEMRFNKIDRHFIETSFPHLQHLCIAINNRDSMVDFSKKNIVKCLRLNPQLQSLEIHLPYRQGMTLTTLLNMISNNSSISKLKISVGTYTNAVSAAELTQFAGAFPAMVELELPRHRLSANDAIMFICQLHSLKMFRFILSDLEYDYFLEHLDNGWRATDSILNGWLFISTFNERRIITLNR